MRALLLKNSRNSALFLFAKSSAAFMLQSIGLPKILVAAIFCKHYEIELYKELVYYFNRSQNKVPEFKSIKSSAASFGDLMNIISNTQKQYDVINQRNQPVGVPSMPSGIPNVRKVEKRY